MPLLSEEIPETGEEMNKNYKKRLKANDPVALCLMGMKCVREEDYEGAIEYYTKAAELGDMDAHYQLSLLYRNGKGVEKDEKKSVYHAEVAAIGGHPIARYNLGCYEGNNGMHDRATKHFIIAAKLGYDDALESVKKSFRLGLASKEDFEAALRGHQAAVDATKSERRDTAYAFFN